MALTDLNVNEVTASNGAFSHSLRILCPLCPVSCQGCVGTGSAGCQQTCCVEDQFAEEDKHPHMKTDGKRAQGYSKGNIEPEEMGIPSGPGPPALPPISSVPGFPFCHLHPTEALGSQFPSSSPATGSESPPNA